METQIFHPCKNILIFYKKKSSKRNQNPSRYYYNSIRTNLEFQHKPNLSSFKKSSDKKIDLLLLLLLLLLPRGLSKSLKLLYSIMNF